MTNRAEVDLNSSWTYDTQPHGVGKLAPISTTAGFPIPRLTTCLRHMSGAVVVYQKYGYMAEMQAAIKAWEERLTAMLRASTTHPTTNDV
jgi:hypothetical protein